MAGVREIAADIPRNGQAREQARVLRHGATGCARLVYGLLEPMRIDLDPRWNPAIARAERAQVHLTVVPIAHGGAGECREIAVAARVHPCLGSDPVPTAVVVENDRGSLFAFPLRLAHEAVEEDIDARRRAEAIERQL